MVILNTCHIQREAQCEAQYEIHLPPDEIGYGVGEEDAQRDTGTRYSDLDPPPPGPVAFCCVSEDIIPGEERRGKERKGEERRGKERRFDELCYTAHTQHTLNTY
jgi:hypothetical protein